MTWQTCIWSFLQQRIFSDGVCCALCLLCQSRILVSAPAPLALVFEHAGTCLGRTRRFFRVGPQVQISDIDILSLCFLTDDVPSICLILTYCCVTFAVSSGWSILQIMLQWQNTAHLLIAPSNVLPGPVKLKDRKMSLEILQTQEVNLGDVEKDSCLVNIENDDPHESEELELKQFERLENLLRCVNQ
mgnify:CR=1 FL=1